MYIPEPTEAEMTFWAVAAVVAVVAFIVLMAVAHHVTKYDVDMDERNSRNDRYIRGN